MIKILDDKYYLKYKYLFNYNYNKFNIVNQNILYNYILFSNDKKNKICNSEFLNSTYTQAYSNIVLRKDYNIKLLSQLNQTNLTSLNFNNFIINNNYYKNKSYLIITKLTSLVQNIYYYNNKDNIDIILFYDSNLPLNYIKEYTNNLNLLKKNYNIISILNILLEYNLYINYLKNLKNDKIIKKYDTISCHIGYILGLGLTASYKMSLETPNIISTIAMSIKLLEKNGSLLLFWTIINVNIPIIKKILSILSYGFKNVEIIDNDINQNLLISVPEYYIKCSGYKDNITDDLINKLLDIVTKTLEYTYNICDVLDYYEDYTEKHPNHSLFYNKTDERETNYKLTKKQSSSSSSSSLQTRKSTSHNKSNIKPIYYIEDINIPELDEIMKDSHLQFKVSVLANKLEGIFIGYFEMVNNLILNAITKDKNGNLIVKKEAILQKDITNLTKLIAMFEHNKLPYNKHALKVLLKKKDEIIDHFYSLDTPVNQKFIQYTDRMSKLLNKSALSHFKSSKRITKKYDFNILNEYYAKIKIAHQVKNKLLEDVKFEKHSQKTPKSLKHTIDEFASGLSDYLNINSDNNNTPKLPLKINNSFLKLWEILSTFTLISHKAEQFKVLHLCEAPGQMIVCTRYWVEQNCEKLNANMENYDWMANSLNPYNYETRQKYASQFGNVFSDNYGLIKDNYDKWLWGSDNTGDITNINNIKSIMNTVKKQWLGGDGSSNNSNGSKLDLIISDGSISINMNTQSNSLYIQKLDLAQLITVIACSSIDGYCCVKHYIPYKDINDIGNSIGHNIDSHATNDTSSFFIGYLYMYYIAFDSISLYKPNTSNPNNGEFYVIGKGFKGISEEQLKNLMTILSTFTLNSCIIEKEHIPETFISQINNFLESMSNINILAIEKQNLLLTCYKNLGEDDLENKYAETNKILKCNNFLDEKKIDNMIIPKYKEWVKTFNFV